MCARVKLEIKQELTLERQAFDAHMRITNGLNHITLENVRVDISFSDEAGNSVVASSDPGSTDALFFIRLDTLENIDAVDGTGSVDPASTADIHWLIIPATGASNGVPHGTLYYVGARLTYTVGGEENITEVVPDYIFVNPMPQITIDYFLPADVYGDDAFTPQIEPPVPFSLGVRITNNGSGVATGMKIKSAQPRIKENDQGLLIGFVIEGSEVNGRPRTPNLLVDFGDIAPGTSNLARWVMTCTLSGEFVEFSADYSHSDELGGELTSLLDAVNTHILVRDVLVDVAGRDLVRDFLAREGGGYRVYESENVDTVVVNQSAGSNLNGATLTTPPTEGFMYVKLLDPHNGQMELRDMLRSDGKRIKPENAWLSKTRNGEGWNYFLNLFDVNTTGSYSLAFGDTAAQNNPPVLQVIGDRTVVEGEAFSFQVTATDEDGTTPALAAKRLPALAGFVDQGNGTGNFRWTPAEGQAGLFEITFTASDGLLSDSRSVLIIVNPIGDRDGDGMPDAWEIANFGDLSHDGSADSDGDGISDLEEFLLGTDPDSSNAPTVPGIFSPADKAEVLVLLPDLVVRNSSDPDGDLIFYTFELYSDEGMTTLISGLPDVSQGVETTTWNVPVSLTDNTWYFWHVRATDGRGFSSWAYGSFFVNTENDPPGSFNISSPGDGSEVSTQTPLLEVTNSVDVDGDVVTYSFEVYGDLDMTAPPVAVSGGIPEGPDGTSQWTVNGTLDDNTWYFWRVVAMDEHGARNETELVSFFVNLANDAPGEPEVMSPRVGSEVVSQELDLVVTNAFDVDWDELTYLFELDKVNTFDSESLLASGEVSEGQDRTSWHLSALEDNSTYFWRVKASDGLAESQWVQGSFFVNRANDNPSAPGLKNPGVGAWVDTLTPKLELHASQDPDNDRLIYRFEVYDQLSGTLVAAGESEIPEWVVSPGLADNVWYYWRAEAEDEHHASSGWMDAVSLFTDSNGVDDPPGIEILESSQDLFTNAESILIRWQDNDPDSNAEIALYYNTNPSGGGSTLIVEGLKEDPDGQGDSYPWDISGIGEGTYYVHAMISDGNSSGESSTQWAVTIDRTAPTLQASPPGGTYMSARIVTLSSDEPGDIYYTLDGSDPTPDSPKYSLPIEIPETATLTFMALDRAGNRSEAVTVIYTIRAEGRSLIESAIEVLEEYLDWSDKWIYKRIVKAIKPLKKSLDDRYWETDNLLTRKGEKVFEEGKKAVKELKKILNRKKNYMGGARDAALEAVDLLIQAYRALAFEEIKQALDTAHSAGCCYDEECVDVSHDRDCREAVKDIAKARKEMKKALKEYDRGRFDKAVDHYKEAWEEAREALEELFDHDNDDDSDSDKVHKDRDDDSDSDDGDSDKKLKDKDDDDDSDDDDSDDKGKNKKGKDRDDD